MWALIIDSKVCELTDIDPIDRFHPSLQWVPGNAGIKTGWTFDGDFHPPATPTNEQLAADLMIQRDQLMAAAQLQILPLQFAIDSKQATPDEKNLLGQWKQYCIDLSRITAQPNFPQTVSWPELPTSI